LNTTNQLPLLIVTIGGNIKRESLITIVHSVSPTSVVRMQGIPAQPICPPRPPQRRRGRPPKQVPAATSPDTSPITTRQVGESSTSAVGSIGSLPLAIGAAADAAINASQKTVAGTVCSRTPSRDYLLPLEALTNPDWGSELHPKKTRGRPRKTVEAPVQERDYWTLEHDLDIPIGVGNDDIFDLDEDTSPTSDNSYFSAEEDDGEDYTWEGDAPYDQEQSMWPPELLHTLHTSRKRPCKQKAPLWPELDDFSFISLADAEHGEAIESELVVPLRLRQSTTLGECALEKEDGDAGERQRATRQGEIIADDRDFVAGEMEGREREGVSARVGVQKPMPGGVEVGRGWEALYTDPTPTQRYTADHTLTQGRGCNVGAPTTDQAALGAPGFYPEHDVDEEELFYENPELEQLDSEDEEDMPEEVQVLGGFIRPPTVPDPTSIKHIFREETWSQSTNEYAQGALPFVGDLLGVKKTYRRMPSFLHLFGLFWTREVLRNICIETNRYARVVHGGKTKGGDDWYDVQEKEL
jgi:hypothetical protein